MKQVVGIISALGLFAACASGGGAAPASQPATQSADTGRLTYYALGSAETPEQAPVVDTFRITNALPVPAEFPRYCDAGLATDPSPGTASRFRGHLTYDRDSHRMWLLSFGPPSNTRGASVLMEVNRKTGMNIAKAEMPFEGEFGPPAYADGILYVGLYHRSTIYKVDVSPENFGKIVGEVPVPKLTDLDLTRHKDRVFRYPFFSFHAMAVAPNGNIVLHSDELQELITLDRETGHVVNRVPTVGTIVAMTQAEGPNGEFLLLANSDPAAYNVRSSMRRFEFRSAMAAAPMSASRPVEESGVVWLLLEPNSGEILASTWRSPSRIDARGIGMVSQKKANDAPYGQFEFVGTGHDGIVAIEWAPTNVALSVVRRSDLPSHEHHAAP